MKGIQHREIDKREFAAWEAMANGYATNAKKPKEKQIFDADKARKKLDKGEEWKNARQRVDKVTLKRAGKALKKWKPVSTGKGENK